MIQVVGIGPGRREGRTIAADDALRRAEVIVGYTTYVELVRDEFAEKRFVTTGMRGEKERCVQALLLSREGRRVALICSGDAQVYGMASLLLGMAEEGDEIEVVPGVTAALSAAAVLGSPLCGDFAVVSLSDQLTPWATIERRLRAAAAALASCLWQRDGACPERVGIVVPAGKTFAPEIIAHGGYVCGVIKDGGDDPDITTGSEVRARVRLMESDGGIRFLAGDGVGTITLPGMKLPVGEAAINPVPRRMIEQAVRQVFPARAAEVTVSIPGGEELAKRTFNPRLGVVGGLSVLGTTGVVRPMSEEALKETIRLELSVRKSQGAEEIGLVFGSQGERAANALFPCMQAVQMSNFVGFALDCAAELGFARATLLGQPGKLVKVSGGSMQTHSQYGDGRRETLIAHLALMGAPVELLEFVRQSVTLDGCISPIYGAGFDAVWTHLADAAAAYAAARVHGEMRVDAVMLDAKGQILGRSTSL